MGDKTVKLNLLAEDNICGRTILKYISRGNAIIAELLRLGNHIPTAFRQESLGKVFKERGLTIRYSDIIFDFSYLKTADKFDNRIQSSAELLDFDEDFKNGHLPVLERFFILFESIYKYVQDICQYFKDLEEGVVFIHHTFEKCLVDKDGKQLFAESFYLYGVMLLLLDMCIPGDVRERMLMSYYRYKGAGEIPNIDEVCKLCRDTGYRHEDPNHKQPKQYPLKYFQRFKLPSQVINMIIGRLRSDDVYLQGQYYPLPAHRSTALATQAAMLYVLLYFQPNTLIKEHSTMREIVDKNFPDNWVISFYMGFSVDLSVRWVQFPAAKAAIANSIGIPAVANLVQFHMKHVHECLKQLKFYLTEGQLTETYVLDNINKMLAWLRQCNVSLRWLILHRTCEKKKLFEIISKEVDPELILLLLLDTAQFEFVLKSLFENMLEKKLEKWTEAKSTAKERVAELGRYFSGTVALQKEKDEQLQNWFTHISKRIDEIDFKDSTLAGRKIQALITALVEVEEFHQIDKSLQVKQYLNDTREYLKRMIRLANVKDEVLVNISTIADVSYAWEIINDYVQFMQIRIKKDPSIIIKMRSTFLKLASILELPLVRIMEAQSTDVVSVSKYYSSELVGFIRRTLDIIPMSMFRIMNQIIEIRTHKLDVLPTKFPRLQLKEFAQAEVRYELAKLTHEVSKYTEGILAMKTTLVGVVEIDPKQLLEDGVRKELVRQIATSFDKNLTFSGPTMNDLNLQLQKLEKKLGGMCESFEYIQDFIGIYGLKIWQEESQRIINYFVEQEVNRYKRRKVYEHHSLYQSKVIPIPRFQSPDPESNTCMGRLVKMICDQSDSRRTMYVDQLNAWYDFAGKEVLGINFFTKLREAVTPYGLNGVDTVLCFQITKKLQKFRGLYDRYILDNKSLRSQIENLKQQVLPSTGLIPDVQKVYTMIGTKLNKLFSNYVHDIILIGSKQILRRHIANELKFGSKLDSNELVSTVETMNHAILTEIQEHKRHPDKKPYPVGKNQLLSELDSYMEMLGISNPYEKVYISSSPLPHIGFVLFILVCSNLNRFAYERATDTLVRASKKDFVDGPPFIIGVQTILQQFHTDERHEFLTYIGQFVRSLVADSTQSKSKKAIPSSLPPDIKLLRHFLVGYSKVSGADMEEIESYFPEYLL